ncbi:hypothetical protein P691DRAFT_295167 [Macrolepiota fuliginosa MF-IS2]|uniref:Uncharacterized protein n=1 Tax=Macrolepiota fuliginosa MF-IS2 TaxID=1400762 RepID=A0A9P6C848_9AGAR|nr:hypothetical protein P691DRAFT_295167 [Macrolepiota fuliginosa MF-IS2]
MALSFIDHQFVLRSERYWFRGIILSSICYGISFALYVACANLLVSRITGSDPSQPPMRTRRRWDIFSLVYITFMFACCTISILVVGISGEKAYVDFRTSPGGPSAYFVQHTFSHVTILKAAYISFLLCNWGATGLMLWRCVVIYKHSLSSAIVNAGIPRWVLWMVIPSVLSLMSIVTSIIFLIQTISPSLLSKHVWSMNWTVIWGSIAVALEWTLTGMITARLLIHRQDMRKIVGEKYCLGYTGIATMLIESSGILSCFTVFYLISFSMHSPTLVMLPYILTQVQVISPLMIVYRVVTGRAWTRNAILNLESLPTLSVAGQQKGVESNLTLRSGTSATNLLKDDPPSRERHADAELVQMPLRKELRSRIASDSTLRPEAPQSGCPV